MPNPGIKTTVGLGSRIAGESGRLHAPAIAFRHCLILLSTEGLRAAVMVFDMTRCPINDFQSRLIARLVIIVPGTHSMMTQKDALSLRVVPDQLLDLQSDIEAWP